MPKQTLEAALLARREDPRALRGAISIVKGKPRIVFGVVGDHRRFSVDVDGDDIALVDDPRGDEAEEAAEQVEEAPEGDPAPEGDGEAAEGAQAEAEQASEAETPAAEVEAEVEAGDKGGRKRRK